MVRISIWGGVRHLAAIFLVISLFVGGVVFGNLNPAMPAYADVYMSAEDSVWQTSGNETCYINYTSKYYIEITSNNGRLMAYVQLKQGDILTSQVVAGGTPKVCFTNAEVNLLVTAGKDACIVYLNGKPLIGAGGASGTSSWRCISRNGRGQSNSGGLYNNISLVTKIDNSHFSSGAGGGYRDYATKDGVLTSDTYVSGGEGNTITGCAPAGTIVTDSVPYPQAGCNYLDTNRATLIQAPNNGTAVSVTLRPVIVTEKQSLSGIDDGVSRIAQNLAAIKTSIDNLQENQSTEAPVFTVVAGKDFSFATNKYDDMVSGSQGGVTVTNSTVGDGAVVVSGKLNTVGSQVITINGKNFIFNIISEPNSSNTTVILR